MCAKSREIIPGLLRRVNTGERQFLKYKKIAQILVVVLIVVLVIMFFQFLGGMFMLEMEMEMGRICS